ncbi:MAG: homoserine dehydrogenase [Tissierellia bacterium]|nr:homoserine dehydrogenase [Tissierellia bacterium]
MIKIALLGFGTVGKGTFEIINQQQEAFQKVTGKTLKVVKILDRRSTTDIPLEDGILTDQFEEVLKSKPDIIAEMTGDIEGAHRFIIQALESKIHVVTANKAVVAKYLEEFLDIADRHKVKFYFEPAVAGVVPIVREIKMQSVINRIEKIYGILNGTGNYILYHMMNKELEFNQVLKEAQDLGFAEADPTDDIKGYDAMRKLRILSTIAFHTKITNEDIIVEGFDRIAPVDIEYIRTIKGRVKHLALLQRINSGYQAIIEPAILSQNSYLGTVEDALNAIEIFGNHFGDLRFMGAGAGKIPTGNAVVEDILDISLGNQHPLYFDDSLRNLNDQLEGQYYFRIDKNLAFPKEWISKKTMTKQYQQIETTKIPRKQLLTFIETHKIVDYFYARLEM